MVGILRPDGTIASCLHVDDYGFPSDISRIQNPVTRAVIPLEPPFRAESRAHLDALYDLLAAYFKAEWDAHLEPTGMLKPIGGEWHVSVPDPSA